MRAGPAQQQLDMEGCVAIMHACSAGIAQLVERNLAKVEVGSSRLLSRSRFSGKAQPKAFSPFSLKSPDNPRRGSKVVMQRPAKPSTPVRFRPPPPILLCHFIARMAKLVDARDLKSLGSIPSMPVRFRLRAPSESFKLLKALYRTEKSPSYFT